MTIEGSTEPFLVGCLSSKLERISDVFLLLISCHYDLSAEWLLRVGFAPSIPIASVG